MKSDHDVFLEWKKRKKRVYIILFFLCLFMAASIGAAALGAVEEPFKYIFAIISFGLVGLMIVIYRCPKCNKSPGNGKNNFCRNCGVPLE